MERSGDLIPGRPEEKPDSVPDPLLPSKKKVAVVVLFFLVGGFFLRRTHLLLFRVLAPGWELDLGISVILGFSLIAAEHLRIIQPLAVLAASVLLYFHSSRHDDPWMKRERRGEIFTGLLNLHILTLIIAIPIVLQSREDKDPLIIASAAIAFLLSTGTACLVGFHLCEGRFLLPLVGLIPALLGFGFVSRDLLMGMMMPIPIVAAVILLLPLLGFGWQLVTLLRSGDGFVLFPTGLGRPMKSSVRVFFGTATARFLCASYHGLFLEPAKAFGALRFLSGQSLSPDRRIDWLFVYLFLVFFLAWRGPRFDLRVRKFTLTILALTAVMSVILSPFHLGPIISQLITSDPPSLFWLARYVILLLWNVLMLISMMRWWARDRFLWPILLLLVNYAPLATYLLSPQMNALPFDYAQIAVQIATILLLLFLLLRGAPRTSEHADDSQNAGQPYSPARP